MSPPVASSEGDGLIHSTGISIADVIKLPVCVDPLWSGPRQDMPYPMFKTLVQQQQAVYELKGGASFQYLMRCLDQPLLSEVQSAYLGGISQEKVWQCLDNRYEASWRTYGMNQRWKHLEQEPGETVHDFADRVKSLASIIHISTGSKPSEVDQAGAFRDGLAPSIYDKVDNFLGPRYVCFEEAKEVAEYYEFKVTKGNSKARNKIAPKNDKNKSHKVMETCRHFLRGFRHEQSSKKAPTGVSDAKGSAMVVIDEANESGEDELWPLVMVVQDGDSVGVSARQLASQIHEELPHWETPATEELKGKVEQWYDAVRWSIPKKELYALWRATRLAMEILGNCRSFKIPVSAVYFYTDSAICLWRLKRPKLDEDLSGLEKRWIREIRVVCEKLRTANLQGKVAHVRSASNLADAPTRSSFQPTTSVTAETARQWSNGSALVVYDPGQKAASHSADVGLSAEDFGLQCMAVVSNAGSETSIGPTTTSPPTEWRQRARVHQDTSPYLSTLKYFIVNGKSPPNCSVPHRLLVDATKYHVVEDNLICRAIRTTSDGQVLHQVVLDPKVDKDNLIYDVIDHYHSRTTHLGADAISREIKAEYYWPSMNRYVRSRLKSCDPCQRVHASVAWRKTVGVLRMKSTVPGQILGVDHVTNLPTGEGNYRHVLTVVCAATGYTWFRASRTVKTAETTKILESLLADISWPLCFVVDGGFKSEHFKEWCSVRNIRVAVLPPHHKSYGGWLERCHLHLRQYFATKHASGEDIKSWPTWIDDLQLVHNLTYFPGLSFGPGDLFFGRQLLRPWRTTSSEGQEVKDALRGVGQLLCPEEDVFLEELYKHRREEYGLRLQQYQRFWEDIKEVQQVKLSRRVRHGPFVFPVGAKCLVYCPEASNFKHSLKFAGPYEIEEWVSGSLRKIKSLGQGGHGLRDISPLQSVYNLCPYYEREDEEIQCWVQCDICDRWIPVTTSMYGRFSAMSTRFSCRLAGLHCRVAVSP
ncbi:hypothetical protein FOL47_010063 [Perkinsus chesapeaki]|uniref:Integrase catalytic domain-containing protein n=1 Tax=Perkinsus chesapeaki TaxID=330153 RepID=A0A7J6MQM1_PERCH|nr:hypothetical protein FOL47_010063 [Perkinsus chesapeaki]